MALNKFIRIMNRRNKKYLYKENKTLINNYRKEFKRHGLISKIKNDFDYLEFEITLESYRNMRVLQENYFNTKESLRDLWNNLNYQEKKFLLYKDLDVLNADLKSFEFDKEPHYIAYFDSLINAYYDHEILIFETSNYRHLLFEFNDILIPVSSYGLAPVKAGFTQYEVIVESADQAVLYSKAVNRFYRTDGYDFGMHMTIDSQAIEIIAQYFLDNDLTALVDYLIEQEYVNKKVLKRLKRMRDKL